MTTVSEEDGGECTDVVHPLVSSLMLKGKFIPRADSDGGFKYDRDEMIRLSVVPLSARRPAYLAKDFDGDDGKFSPFKWLEHRWEVEGIKSRPNNKKLQDALTAGSMDEKAGLSPQRRGFSGGCRAPPTEDPKEAAASANGGEGAWVTAGAERNDRDRLGSASGAKSWRSGAGGGGSNEKYTPAAAAKSHDFKLPFQKSATGQQNGRPGSSTTGGGGDWRTNTGKMGSAGGYQQRATYAGRRDDRGMERQERIPEWADDSTTMNDMIELRGFEEGNKKGAKKNPPKATTAPPVGKENKEKEEKKKENGKIASGSTENANTNNQPPRKGSRDASANADVPSSSSSGIPPALPDSDAELAHLLGLLDMSASELNFHKPAEEHTAVSGSRLSRFFNKTASQGKIETHNASGSHSNTNGEVSRPGSGFAPVGSEMMGGRGVGVIGQHHPHHSSETPPPMPPQMAMMMNSADPSILNKIFAQGGPSHQQQQHVPRPIGAPGDNMARSSQLDKCMDMLMQQQQQPMNGRVLPVSVPINNGPGGVRAMRLEDLERSMHSNNAVRADELESQAHKGNPLQDPDQQAHLMNCLTKLSKQRGGEIPSNSPPQHLVNGGHAPHRQSSSPPPQHPSGGANVPPMPPMNFLPPNALPGGAMPAVPPPGIHPQIWDNARRVMDNQYQQALAANTGLPPAYIYEQVRANVYRQMQMQQQQVHAHAAMALLAHQQAQAVASQRQQEQQQKPRPSGGHPQMIPSSVQRQMNKTSVSTSEEKREQAGSAQMQHQQPPRNSTPPEDMESEAQKAQMANQYAAMMTAMSGGLPMASWKRPAHPNFPANFQPPTPQQVMIAHLQQQQKAAMAALSQQQKNAAQTNAAAVQAAQVQAGLLHKMMSMHQTPQAQQQMAAQSPIGAGVPGQRPTELSQVGPIQSPLEKLLLAAGAFPAGGSDAPPAPRPAPPHVPQAMSLEELERHLMSKNGK